MPDSERSYSIRRLSTRQAHDGASFTFSSGRWTICRALLSRLCPVIVPGVTGCHNTTGGGEVIPAAVLLRGGRWAYQHVALCRADGEGGQEGEAFGGGGARLGVVDDQHLAVGVGDRQLLVAQIQRADLRVHDRTGTAAFGADVVPGPQPAEAFAAQLSGADLSDETASYCQVGYVAQAGL